VPPQIVINVGGGRLSRVVGWLGWLGFTVCLLVLISHSLTWQDYFNTTGEVEEKYFSGDLYGRDKVAIIAVAGAIVDGSFAKQEIDHARKDKHVKAIVLRVVSPGGTIAGSDYIYHHLKKLRDEKQLPLVVSMGSIAASGGYYVSMAVGDREKSIYAEPTTTTGSIGVIIPHYDFSGLLQRFDVKEDSLATHPRKQMLSMTRPMTEDHRELLTAYLNEAFTRFKEIVKEGRPAFRTDEEALNQLATGQVFTAPQAKKLGLVDEIGFLEDAVERAIELAGLDKDKTRVVEYRRTAGLLDFSWLGESRSTELQLARLLEWNTPQAYYLATTMPALLTHAAQRRDE
jgi:protease-4